MKLLFITLACFFSISCNKNEKTTEPLPAADFTLSKIEATPGDMLELKA